MKDIDQFAFRILDNYRRLLVLAPDLLTLKAGESMKSSSEGYMDLCCEVLRKDKKQMVIALSHYYLSNGDLVPDPDVEIKIHLESKAAEALTYQDTYFFNEVYMDGNRYRPKVRKSLNGFLNQWLKNCIAQGHHLSSNKK